MSSLDGCAEKLSDFGITFNQARVYITTAQLGMASVSHISRLSKVPREEVYRILPKLEKLGLIEKILGRPIKIKATPVEDVLSILIKRERDIALKRVSALMAEKDTFLKNFNIWKMKPELEETAHFTLISPREAITCKELSMINAAEREIDITTSGDRFKHFFTNYHESIKESINKGVKFRVILKKVDLDDSIVRIMEEYESPRASLSVRFADQLFGHYVVADYQEALVATSFELTALGKSPYLWTDDSGFIGLIAKDFESTWHTSANIKTLESEDVEEKLMRFLRGLRPRNHLLFLYRSLEAKYNVLCNYIKVGLENGEATVYVASEENLGQIRDAMKRFDIEVEKDEKTGALLILGYDEFYIINGKFSISTTTHLIKQLYEDAIKRGFTGCRVFGEASCFFQHNLNNELMEYEKALHRILDCPIIGMCAYNADDFEKCDSATELYNELLKAHGTVLFTQRDKHLGKFEIR